MAASLILMLERRQTSVVYLPLKMVQWLHGTILQVMTGGSLCCMT